MGSKAEKCGYNPQRVQDGIHLNNIWDRAVYEEHDYKDRRVHCFETNLILKWTHDYLDPPLASPPIEPIIVRVKSSILPD